MNKAWIYGFTSKVYSRLKDKDFIIKFFRSKDTAGLCHFDQKLIELNPHEDILSTLVHEMLHSIYPEWKEKKVVAHENLIMQKLSHKQMANLTVAMGQALKRAHPNNSKR
jgi:hypothetical protein